MVLLDNLHRAFVESIFESQRDDVLDLRVGVQLALLGRYYERLGDHAVNIGERVQYQVSGWMPEYDGATRARARAVELPGTRLSTLPPVVDRGVVVDEERERRRVESLRRDFVANIGHELRTPVGALVVLAETLHDEVARLDCVGDTSTVERLSERLTLEAGRMGRTIDDLLELSRIEHGSRVEPVEVPVREIVDGALARTGPAAALAEVRVDVSLPDEPSSVAGDRRQLVSALANLVDNGVKYSESGGVVEVSVSADADAVRFVVRDHGAGIPVADQEKVFERFYRVDRARRRDTGGTGLGLAIVRHVALNHDGTVELTSVEGEGATFTLTIPRRFGEGPSDGRRDA